MTGDEGKMKDMHNKQRQTQDRLKPRDARYLLGCSAIAGVRQVALTSPCERLSSPGEGAFVSCSFVVG